MKTSRPGIVQGPRSGEPAVDILDAKTAGLRGMKDPALLELAAQQDRILISHDRRTMTQHFFASGFVRCSLESLLIVWTASEAEEWRDGRPRKTKNDGLPHGDLTD